MKENRAFTMVWEKYQKSCEKIIKWYLFSMMVLFPFYATNQYFHILRDRTQFFAFMTIAAAVLILIVTVHYYFQFLRERYNQGLHASPEAAELKSYIWKKAASLWLADWFLIVFLFICFVSVLMSEYPKESFLGTHGRYQGLLIWLLYGSSYFMIRRFFKEENGFFTPFLCSGLVLSLWGIADYTGIDVFGWTLNIQEGQRGAFTSAFGNINTYTAGMAIFFSISGICLMNTAGRKKNSALFYTMVFFLCCVSLITGQSDNAVIGVTAFFLLVPFLAWKTKQGFYCSILLYVLFLLSLLFVAVLNKFTHNPYIDPSGGILLRFSNETAMTPAFLVVTAALILITVCGLLCCRKKNKAPYRNRQISGYPVVISIWGMAVASGLFCLLLLLLDANFWHPEHYETFAKYLIFNDSWGTHRGLCWRLTMEEYGKFPFLKKLCGSGLETFGLIMKKSHYQEMVTICGQTFDSPHNEALQYLFTTGVFGFLSYYGFLVCGCIKGILSKDHVKEAAAAAVIVYTAVSLVNISVPITQPYVIILMASILSNKNPD